MSPEPEGRLTPSPGVASVDVMILHRRSPDATAGPEPNGSEDPGPDALALKSMVNYFIDEHISNARAGVRVMNTPDPDASPPRR